MNLCSFVDTTVFQINSQSWLVFATHVNFYFKHLIDTVDLPWFDSAQNTLTKTESEVYDYEAVSKELQRTETSMIRVDKI